MHSPKKSARRVRMAPRWDHHKRSVAWRGAASHRAPCAALATPSRVMELHVQRGSNDAPARGSSTEVLEVRVQVGQCWKTRSSNGRTCWRLCQFTTRLDIAQTVRHRVCFFCFFFDVASLVRRIGGAPWSTAYGNCACPVVLLAVLTVGTAPIGRPSPSQLANRWCPPRDLAAPPVARGARGAIDARSRLDR